MQPGCNNFNYSPEADFKGDEFDPLLADTGSNAFTMSPTRWIDLPLKHGEPELRVHQRGASTAREACPS